MISSVYKGSVYAIPAQGKSSKPKAKKKPGGRPVVSQMADISRGILGYGSKEGVSIYSLIAQCLELHGYKKPGNISDKSFAKGNWEKLKGFSKKKAVVVANKPSALAPLSKPFEDTSFIQSKEFLQSFEWRRLRMEALKKYGARCQCCGASPDIGVVMNVDHIKPRKTHPDLALDIDNLQVLCSECNHGKGNWDSTDWRK